MHDRPQGVAARAATDAKILAARATMDAGAKLTGSDLARAAGVAPKTARASYRRIRDSGGWGWAPLVKGHGARGKPVPIVLGKARNPFADQRSHAADTARAEAPSYLLHGDPYKQPETRFEALSREARERKERKAAGRAIA